MRCSLCFPIQLELAVEVHPFLYSCRITCGRYQNSFGSDFKAVSSKINSNNSLPVFIGILPVKVAGYLEEI